MVSTSGSSPIWSEIFMSRSKILMAKKRFCSTAMVSPSFSSIAVSAVSSSLLNGCTIRRFSCSIATRTAACAASVIPVPFSAETVTTSHPNSFDSLAMSILSPALFTTSIMLMAMTTGIPSSRSCVVKYRLRSIFVPSTMFKIASGRSVIK